ncbi:YceI family protein [Tsukamurella serpentis]
MSETTIDQDSGVLEVHTDVAGRSARLGHRLVLAPATWRTVVGTDDGRPTRIDVTVEASSLQVISGHGGLTPLSAPERAVATANAHRSLKVKDFPLIEYHSTSVDSADGGFDVRGTLTICGRARPCEFALRHEPDQPSGTLAAVVSVAQTDFGIKPFSLMMGTLSVADEVTVLARAIP